MSTVLAFDADDTLNIPGSPRPGPIDLNDVIYEKQKGNLIGICGNHI